MKTSDYPATIEQTLLNLRADQVELEDYCLQLAIIEDGITAEILAAKDEKDKPLFPNEQARGIELRARLRENTVWQRVDKSRRDAEYNKAKTLAQLERLRGEFKVSLIEREYELRAA